MQATIDTMFVNEDTLQKSEDELLMMPKFLAKYIEKKMI